MQLVHTIRGFLKAKFGQTDSNVDPLSKTVTNIINDKRGIEISFSIHCSRISKSRSTVEDFQLARLKHPRFQQFHHIIGDQRSPPITVTLLLLLVKYPISLSIAKDAACFTYLSQRICCPSLQTYISKQIKEFKLVSMLDKRKIIIIIIENNDKIFKSQGKGILIKHVLVIDA